MIFTYIISKKTKDGIRGFFLSVNEKGIPVDYKYTEEIKVTKVQKYLFGDTLEKYLKLNVLFEKFLKTIDFNIDYIFVKDESFLNFEDFNNIIYFEESDENPLDKTGDFLNISNDWYFFQHSFSGNPLKVKVLKPTVLEGLGSIINVEGQHVLADNFDLAEPFHRLMKLSEEL